VIDNRVSNLPTPHPIDRRSVYIAVGLLSGIGAMISSTMPMVIGAMSEAFQFSESQLGDLIAAFNITFTLIAVASLFFVRKINWKLAAFLASGISVASLFALTLTDNYQPIMMLFGGLGIGMGGLYALGMAVMSDSKTPDRAFGIKLGLETLPPTFMLFALPILVIPTHGFTGMAYAMAAMCLLIGLLSGYLPSRGVKNNTPMAPSVNERTQKAAPNRPVTPRSIILSLVTLLASIVFFSGIIASWAFLEIIGTDKGIPTDKVGITLALSMVSAAIGAFIAAWLGNKHGRILPMIGIILINVISLIILWQSSALITFAIGAILFTLCVNYALAYFFGLSAEVDLSGRFVVLSAMTLSLGGVVGPAVAGRLMESHGFEIVLIFTAICSILSLAVYMTVVRASRA